MATSAVAVAMYRRPDGVAPPGELDGAFSRYLRRLAAPGDIDSASFSEMWRALGAAVVAELRRRSLWTSPPSYLGIVGWPSWQTAGSRRQPGESALDELLTDCYVFVFHDRLRALVAQLEVKGNIDGLVRLYLRNYLHDRRKQHDLLGFRIFETVRQAVRQAVDAGELWVVGGDPKILNPTLLSADPQESVGSASPGPVLQELVERWAHDLLPDLITAVGARRRQVVLRLRRRLVDLEAEGVKVVRFGDLVDPLKRVLRSRWAALFETGGGNMARAAEPGFAGLVQLVEPESVLAERDSFERLIACVAGKLERRGESERSRHYLRALWGFLQVYATDHDAQAVPSARRLARLLRIPRKRLPSLWEILRDLVGRCQAKLSGPSARAPGGRSL